MTSQKATWGINQGVPSVRPQQMENEMETTQEAAMSLQEIRAHINRDRGLPSPEDIAAAGLVLVDDCAGVVRPDSFTGTWLGPVAEFGIVGRVFDKDAQALKKGRFLVQLTEMHGEIVHFDYGVRNV